MILVYEKVTISFLSELYHKSHKKTRVYAVKNKADALTRNTKVGIYLNLYSTKLSRLHFQ